MMRIILLISLLTLICACSNREKPSVPEAAADGEAAVEPKTQPTEQMDEDVRLEIKKNGPVVVFHCEAREDFGTITATRVDTGTPKELFKVDAEFTRLAEKPCDLMYIGDMNGDELPDVMTPWSFGVRDGYYMGWVWDDAAGTFVKVPEFESLGNPSTTGRNQIRTDVRIGWGEYEFSLWELNGTVLTRQKTVGIYPCEIEPDSGEEPSCFERYDIEYVNGTPHKTVKKIQPSEAMGFNPGF